MTVSGWDVTVSEDSKAIQVPGWLVGAIGTVIGIVVSVVGFLMFFDGRYAPVDTKAEVARLEVRIERKADADEAATKAELLLIDQRLGFSAAQLARIEKKVDAVSSAIRSLPPGPRQSGPPQPGGPPHVAPSEAPAPDPPDEQTDADPVEDRLDEILRELERRRRERAQRKRVQP